ncbi:hypothetical protein VPH35_089523 [Triticum aestivum]|uniref:Uncharacterized protein n=1 Tax=Triticum turgidum subsp. durum TaxID=4567 RepID=A0A9R1AJT1_TRITD|nr:unnamed protein product [Triticum turgidum subsp. durum]
MCVISFGHQVGVSPTSNNKTPHFLNCAVIGSCPPRPLRWSRYSASFGFACCRGRRKAQANYISAPRLLTGDIDVCLTSGNYHTIVAARWEYRYIFHFAGLKQAGSFM